MSSDFLTGVPGPENRGPFPGPPSKVNSNYPNEAVRNCFSGSMVPEGSLPNRKRLGTGVQCGYQIPSRRARFRGDRMEKSLKVAFVRREAQVRYHKGRLQS